MSILKIASLVVTANTYEESKILAVVPSNGSGDLDFVRASTKTRVNPEGIIEEVPYNLLSYSQLLSDNSWSKIRTSISSTLFTSPSDLVNSNKVIPSLDNNTHRVDVITTLINNNTYCYSFFAKKQEINCVQVEIGNNGVGANFVNFNLETGVNTNFGTATSQMISLPNNWYRCVVFNSSTSWLAQRILIGLGNNDVYFFAGAVNSGLLIWGAQLGIGSVLKPYFPTTNRLHVPSIDYTGGGCPSILVEPQRTNLSRYSEDLTNILYEKGRVSISSNVGISPSGDLTADKVIPDNQNDFHNIKQFIAVPSGVSVSFSVFAKASGYNFLVINTSLGSSSGNSGPIINLLTGAIVGVLGSTGYNAKVVSLPNEWFRIDFTYLTSGTTTVIDLNPLPTSSVSPYQGNFTSGVLIWGYSLEVASSVSSYIPTTTAAVTRNQDLISKTGISDLIGQTEGVIFLESALFSFDSTYKSFGISDSSDANRIIIQYADILNELRFIIIGGGEFNVISTTVTDANAFNKIALKYSSNKISFFVNGVKILTELNNKPLPINLNRVGFDSGTGGSQFFGKVNGLQLYKNFLSDEECILLTSTSFNTYQEMATALNYVTQ
jgi:hypothetical protein